MRMAALLSYLSSGLVVPCSLALCFTQSHIADHFITDVETASRHLRHKYHPQLLDLGGFCHLVTALELNR